VPSIKAWGIWLGEMDEAVEKYAQDKLSGFNLGEIEWYHRLRNQLYHQGNGLTVELEKVEVYAESKARHTDRRGWPAAESRRCQIAGAAIGGQPLCA
jgi:hypothetical protein